MTAWLAGVDLYLPQRGGWVHCNSACTDADGSRILGVKPIVRVPAWAVLLRRERVNPGSTSPVDRSR